MTESMNTFFKKLSTVSLEALLRTALTLVLGYIVVKIVMHILHKVLNKTSLDLQIKKTLLSLAKIVMYFILFTMCMTQLGISPTSLLTLLGAFGLAITLALQDSLANLAGGISVVAAKPFKLGDYVQVSGVEGTVSAIGFTHTTLNTIDNKRIYVPNSQMAKEKIINFSAEDRRRLEMIFSIGYHDDTKAARELITIILSEDIRIKKDPQPFIKVWALNESSVDIMVRAWVSGDDFLDTKCDLLEKVKIALQENGFNIPFKTVTIEMKN